MSGATSGATEDLGGAASTAVVPFWHRMPRLFRFPFQRAPLLRNVLASALSCIVACVLFEQFASAPARSFGLALLVFCAGSFYVAQYSMLVIERTASGYLDTHGYPPSSEAIDWVRPIKMFLVLVLVPIFLGIVGHFLPYAGKLALLAWALLLPASVMVMTLTDSFAEAVNPARCLKTALGIGTPYLLLCLYLVLLNVGFKEVMDVILHGVSWVQGAPVASGAQGDAPPPMISLAGFALPFLCISFAANYFLILTCVLIGYAMYQYSDALGVAVVGPGEARASASTSAATHARRQREALVGKMVAAGEIAEAIRLISDEISEHPADLALHVRLHKLLLHEGSRPKIEAHAERYLVLLLSSSNYREALALWEQTRALIPGFMPRDGAHCMALANEALAADKTAAAADLIRGFDRRFADHPKLPDVYVIGARVMLQSHQPDQAKQLLEYVVSKYPNAPAAVEGKRYLERFS